MIYYVFRIVGLSSPHSQSLQYIKEKIHQKIKQCDYFIFNFIVCINKDYIVALPCKLVLSIRLLLFFLCCAIYCSLWAWLNPQWICLSSQFAMSTRSSKIWSCSTVSGKMMEPFHWIMKPKFSWEANVYMKSKKWLHYHLFRCKTHVFSFSLNVFFLLICTTKTGWHKSVHIDCEHL